MFVNHMVLLIAIRRRARMPVDFYKDACPAIRALLMLGILEESRFKRQLKGH